MARKEAPLRASAPVALLRPGDWNSRSGTSGSAERDSTATNAGQERHARGQRRDDLERGPAQRFGPDHAEDDGQHAGGAEHGPGDVERPRAGRGDPAGGHEHRRQGEQEHPDRDVDEEHPLPAERVDEDAAGDDAEGAAEAGQPAPDAHRDVALAPVGEGHGEDREGGGRHERSAETLHGADADEHALRRRQAAGQRRDGEEAEAGGEDPAAAQQVGEPAAEQQEPAEGQRVGADHPLQVVGGEVQRGLHVRAAPRSRS